MTDSNQPTLFIDCSAGAAGDMLLGALLDLAEHRSPGAKTAWLAAMGPLLASEKGGRCELHEVFRAGVPALKVDFYVGGVHADHHPHGGHGHNHSNGHSDGHSHALSHGHSHGDHHGHEHHHHRPFQEILQFIDDRARDGALPSEAADLSRRVFTTLARGEAEVHGATLETVQFHEIGAFDSVMDILGFSLAYIQIGSPRIVASPAALGSGHVHTAHGILPVPTPVVRVIMRNTGLPAARSELSGECLTPTGAAILATVVSHWNDLPPFDHTLAESRAVQGNGAGTRDPSHPNVVRARMVTLAPAR